MADIEALYGAFENFCSFGGSRTKLSGSGSISNLSGNTMEGAKFAKFCRETYILDSSITMTDVDIVFNKVKSKTERRINFDQFQSALKHLAIKKFSKENPQEAYVHLVRIISTHGAPVTNNTTAQARTSITQRINNPKNFTGTQNAQFGSLSSVNQSQRPSVQAAPVAASKRTYNNIATKSSEVLDKNKSQPKRTMILPTIGNSKTTKTVKLSNGVYLGDDVHSLSSVLGN